MDWPFCSDALRDDPRGLEGASRGYGADARQNPQVIHAHRERWLLPQPGGLLGCMQAERAYVPSDGSACLPHVYRDGRETATRADQCRTRHPSGGMVERDSATPVDTSQRSHETRALTRLPRPATAQ
jgi:hypothetical protein